MRNVKICLLRVIILLFLTNGLIAGSCSVPKPDKKYRYHLKIKFRKVKPGEDMQYVYYPLPRTNDYQTISDFDTHGGEIFNNTNSIERYVRYTITDDQQPAEGKWGEVRLEFNYTPTKSEYKPAKIEKIYEYDTKSDIYKRYTTKYYEILDTENALVKRVSDSIWNRSTDVLDYAKKCDAYVVDNYTFQDNPGLWNTTDEIIFYDGGDCGNLSSLFITLLRCKKIPARHVITKGHAWAEFYLENNGWIPVDPTYQTFGKVVKGYGLIRSNEIVYSLKLTDDRGVRVEHLNKNHIFYPSHMPFECDEEITKTPIKN